MHCTLDTSTKANQSPKVTTSGSVVGGDPELIQCCQNVIIVVHCEFMLGIIKKIMDKFDEKAIHVSVKNIYNIFRPEQLTKTIYTPHQSTRTGWHRPVLKIPDSKHQKVRLLGVKHS